MNTRLSGSLLLAVLPTGLVSAQPPAFDRHAWFDQQVDQYVERAGLSDADQMLWCDPVPNCTMIPLKAVDSRSGSATVIVFLGREPTRDQVESLTKDIRASGGRVFAAIGPSREVAVALRRRLSNREDR